MTRPRRILMTHDRFAPQIRGGGEVMALELARQFAAMGHHVRVLTTGPADLKAPDDSYEIRRLPVHPYRFNLCVGEIARELERADIVQTFNYHACLPSLAAARRVGKPVVCTIFGQFGRVWRETRGPLIGRAFEAFERWQVLRPYDRITFLSDFSRDQAIGWGVDPSRALVTTPGIDHEAYRPAPSKDPVALFVGKFEVRKGVPEVVALARALPWLQVRLMGWGPMEAELKAITDLPNLTVMSFDAGERLRQEYARARLFVFPSRAETFGIVLAEAMAAGCAVVSSVDLPFEGIHIPPADAGALIDAVRTLWADPEAMASMGRRNVEVARQYSWPGTARRLLQTYDELLGEPRTPPLNGVVMRDA